MATRLQSALPAEHREALGHVVANFALLEYHLTRAVWALIGHQDLEVCGILTAELSFRDLVNLASSLVKYRVPDAKQQEELEGLLGRLFGLEGRRNQVMHSLWVVFRDASVVPGPPKATIVRHVSTVERHKFTAKHKDGLRHQVEQMTAQDLETVADEIGESTQSLLDALQRIARLLPEVPTKP